MGYSGNQDSASIKILDATTEVKSTLLEKTIEFNKKGHEILRLKTSRSHRIIKVEILPKSPDGMILDNVIWLIKDPDETLTISSDLTDNWERLLGLKATDSVAPIFRLHSNLSLSTPMKSDVLFTNRNVGGSSNTWRIRFPVLGKTRLSTGNFQINRSHPLLYNIQLSNVLWEYDPSKRLRGTTLIEIDSIPVLTEEMGSDGIRRNYNFNIGQNSTLFQHPDWPILLNAILTTRTDLYPGLQSHLLSPGESIIGQGLPDGKWAVLFNNTITSVQYQDGLIQTPLHKVGLYSVTNNGSIYGNIAVNMISQKESNLLSLSNHTLQSSIAAESITNERFRWDLLGWLCLLGVWLWDWRITS